MLIGLTGTFGSGKSTVLKLFRKEGAVTISADRIVHSLLRRKSVKEAIKSLFGPTVLKQGEVNRAALAKIVFGNRNKRRKLEKLIHPLVKKNISQKGKVFTRKNRLVVAEVPLLFESKFSGPFDYIVCVSAKPEIIRSRMQKKGFSPAEVRQRRSSQWKLPEKEKRSDAVIDNSESRAKTEKQVLALMHRLRSLRAESAAGVATKY